MSRKNKVSIVIVVNDDDEVLAIKRSDDCRSFKGYWNFPGGGVEIGESALSGAMRELFEETSLIVNKKDLYHFKSHKTPALDVKYFITFNYDGDILLNNESTDYKWYNLSKIKLNEFVPMPINMLDELEDFIREKR
jgi:8-oxo-dGTP diphosphatase